MKKRKPKNSNHTKKKKKIPIELNYIYKNNPAAKYMTSHLNINP